MKIRTYVFLSILLCSGCVSFKPCHVETPAAQSLPLYYSYKSVTNVSPQSCSVWPVPQQNDLRLIRKDTWLCAEVKWVMLTGDPDNYSLDPKIEFIVDGKVEETSEFLRLTTWSKVADCAAGGVWVATFGGCAKRPVWYKNGIKSLTVRGTSTNFKFAQWTFPGGSGEPSGPLGFLDRAAICP